MPQPRRTPWVALDVDVRKDERLVALPSDTARYGYVAGILAEARLATPRGVFANRAHLVEAIGRFARFIPHYLDTGLIEQAPKLCPDCRDRFGHIGQGALVVHNWHPKQNDPTRAERDERYRSRQEPDGKADGEPDGQTDAVSPRARVQTPDTRHHTQTPRRSSVAESEHRARIPRGAIALEKPHRPDLAALAKRGLTYIRPAELAILDHIADNERAGEWQPISTGQEVIAGWILSAPKRAHLVDHVIQTENRLKLERGARAEEIEQEWREFKEAQAEAMPRANGQPISLGSLLGGLQQQATSRG
jgi:hypothetical protein